MAKTITCDIITGKPAREIEFTWDGDAYTVDLSDDALKTARLADILKAATKREALKPTRRGGKSTTKPGELTAIRVWAQANGHSVAERGRIAARIVEAYREAHK